MDNDRASPAQEAQQRSSIPADLAPGLRIGTRYELTRRIGAGSMGEVWAARHLSLHEEVALKIVIRDAAHFDGSSANARFLFEARIASLLSRKTRHIVQVTDHGEDGRYAYLAMELLDGESLDERLARTGPMPLEKVVPLVSQIARALSVAHGEGIVHRDVKPSNVFVTVDEEGKALIKILDFGIAKARKSFGRIPLPGQDPKQSTLRGFLLGTPAYMSPEQSRGKKIDHRADVWALAVIAYHLLTNELPFDGDTPEDLFALLARFEFTPIVHYRPDLPPAIDDLFDRAFAERVDQRFQTAVSFAGALEHVATIQNRLSGISSRPPPVISLPPPPVRPVNVRSVPPPSRNPTPLGIANSIPASRLARREGRPWVNFLIGGIAVALVFATGGLLAIYFEHDPAPVRDLASTAEPSPPALPPPGVSGPESLPPAPIRPSDLPSAPSPRLPTAWPSAPPSSPAASASAPPKRSDKSEVF